MIFNYEINITAVIAILTAAASLASFYFGTRNSLNNLEKVLGTGMDRLEKNIEMMNKVVMDLALSTQRQDNFEKRTDDRFKMMTDDIRDMKHLKGFIKEPPA
jgi:hypothetical protein